MCKAVQDKIHEGHNDDFYFIFLSPSLHFTPGPQSVGCGPQSSVFVFTLAGYSPTLKNDFPLSKKIL